ncbi:MarR family winged helix-turn-helix transcriptional regulator [Williamsia sterculiae]|uniref:DNA-binding transcriptional regulator, MarR family n=1 Tax=Williamsia sterculiae TaxID=1344003 RepID=A0A1N7FH47_9NOCA|nr:MarR family transcriptional regulator [Williamsia sterculiae]SIR99758.1 DNA-binding transcriptional regulator, MarR family [Williamsia sterculiae]
MALNPVAPSDDLLQLDRQVCFALAVTNRTVLNIYRPLLEPLGLTHPQYLVMLALWERDPRSVRDIGNALMLDSATLSPLLKRLEKAGLLTRQRAVDDERQLDVALTDTGRVLRERALKIPPAVVATLGVTLDDLEELRAVLWKINRAAQTAVSAPGERTR